MTPRVREERISDERLRELVNSSWPDVSQEMFQMARELLAYREAEAPDRTLSLVDAGDLDERFVATGDDRKGHYRVGFLTDDDGNGVWFEFTADQLRWFVKTLTEITPALLNEHGVSEAESRAPETAALKPLTSRERHKGTGDVLKDLAHAQHMTDTSEPGFGEVICRGNDLDFVNRAIRVASGEIKQLRLRVKPPAPEAAQIATARHTAKLASAIHDELHGGDVNHTAFDHCDLRDTANRIVGLVLSAPEAARAQTWQPIETAPRGKVVLMFGVTDRHADGRVANWNMATGHLDFTTGEITWDGLRLTKPYQHRPTHWMPLPPTP